MSWTSKAYKVEIVTPAFPGGPDPRDGEFEGVRPTSIVYGMRWWFRALAGAIWGTTSDGALERIRKAESLVFGTADEKGCQSRVRVAVVENVTDSLPYEPRGSDPTMRYLAYGLYPTDQKTWRRRYIPPGQTFQFEFLITRPKKDGPDLEIPKRLVETLAELWIEFGGLGARWRHGLGGMRDCTVKDAPADTYGSVAAQRLSAAREEMAKFLATLHGGGSPPLLDNRLPLFPVAVAPFLKLAWRADAGLDDEQALKTIFQVWRRGRLRNPDDPRTSSWNAGLYGAFMRGGSSPGDDLRGQRAELAGLGLPIPFGFPQGAQGIKPRSVGVLKPSASERRASPIWLRAVKVAGRRGPAYGILALWWNCVYLPDGEGVVLKEGDKERGRKEPIGYDPKDAEQWFDGFLLGGKNNFRRV